MKIIIHTFNVFAALLLALCLGWQARPVQALEASPQQQQSSLPMTSSTTGVPSTLAPNGIINDTMPTYSWTPITGATQYQYQLLRDATVVYTKTVPASVCADTCLSTPVETLTYSSTYAWKVRSRVSGVWGAFSKERPFTLAPILNSDFEGGQYAWTSFTTRSWVVISHIFPKPVRPHRGAYAAWLGGLPNDTSFVRQLVTVPQNASSLVYWYLIKSSDVCGNDYAKLWINGTLIERYSLCAAVDTGQWVRHSVDLSAYAGRVVYLRIGVDMNGSLNSHLFVDDLIFQAP